MKQLIRKPWFIPAALGGLVVFCVLAFGVFGIQTKFIDDSVSEEVPVFTAGAGASGLESDALDDDLASDMNDAMEDEGTEIEKTAVDAEPEVAEVATAFNGVFVDRSHPAEGNVLVLTDGSAQRFLRFEEFATDNGPDLNVYLSTAAPDADASAFDDDFIDLGDLKGNVGEQNYEIPADVDLDEYQTVVIWCVRFGVAFGAAELTAA